MPEGENRFIPVVADESSENKLEPLEGEYLPMEEEQAGSRAPGSLDIKREIAKKILDFWDTPEGEAHFRENREMELDRDMMELMAETGSEPISRAEIEEFVEKEHQRRMEERATNLSNKRPRELPSAGRKPSSDTGSDPIGT